MAMALVDLFRESLEGRSETLTFSPDATMDENLVSQSIELRGSTKVSITLHAPSNTHVGYVAVDGSDDNSNWNAEVLGVIPRPASGSAFDSRIDLRMACRYLRVRFVFSSGTGTLSGTVTMKG